LTEAFSDRGWLDETQLGRTPRPGAIESIANPARDCRVARAPMTLSKRRKPPGAEVDRVERQPECGQLLAGAVEQMDLRGRARRGRLERQRPRIRRDRVLVDPNVTGPRGYGGGGLAKL